MFFCAALTNVLYGIAWWKAHVDWHRKCC